MGIEKKIINGTEVEFLTDEDARWDLTNEELEREAELGINTHEEDFLPGYALEMDYMNACEADDYRDE